MFNLERRDRDQSEGSIASHALPDVLQQLYPDLVDPVAALFVSECSRALAPYCSSVDSGGGYIFMRGKTGKRLVAQACTGRLPPHDTMTAQIWQELIASPIYGVSSDPAARRLAGYIPDLDWAIDLREGVDFQEAHQALLQLSERYADTITIAAQKVEHAGIPISTFRINNAFEIGIHQLPNSWEIADADCRASWNMPAAEAFCGVFLKCNTVYCDKTAQEALVSDRVLYNLQRADLPQATIAFLRYLTHKSWLKLHEIQTPQTDPIKGGVSMWTLIWDSNFWRQARSRMLPEVVARRQEGIRSGLLALLTLNPTAFNTLLRTKCLQQLELARFVPRHFELSYDAYAYSFAYRNQSLSVAQSGPMLLAQQLKLPLRQVISSLRLASEVNAA